jgi:hypothetical protein
MAENTERWVTVQVVPLPAGWHNVYAAPEQHIEQHTEPCPALLLQELRATMRDAHTHGARGQWTSEREPFDTRVVFATFLVGGLVPVQVVDGYLGTVGPGQTTQDAEQAPPQVREIGT